MMSGAESGACALVFPGQGSQRRGMMTALPHVEDLDRLLDAAEALSGLPLRRIAQEGSPEQLADTRATQPLLYLADWAWGHALLSAGVEPIALAGHSLGEFAALAVAGVFSVEAGLELIVERSRLMAETAAETPGGMAAVLGMGADVVRGVVEPIPGVWVANDNSPGQLVLSGTHEAIEAATVSLTEAGARKVVPLAVAGPFHSPLMEPAREAFGSILGQAAFAEARIPVVQNTDPRPATDVDVITARLARQIVEPVRWTETMVALGDLGATTLVESGPGSVLKGLARRMEGLEAVAVEEAGIDHIVQEVC